MVKENDYDLAIVGGGPAGLTAACLAGQVGLKTVFWPGPVRGEDLRTTALMLPAQRLLEHIGVWSGSVLPGPLSDHCAPLRGLRICDATGRPPQAPTVTFEASEISETEFGWNVPLMPMLEALRARLLDFTSVTVLEGAVTGLEIVSETDSVRLRSTDGTVNSADVCAGAVLAADGGESLCRRFAKIGISRWSYPQTALVASFAHTLPHGDMSVEFHRTSGPLTTVPLPGRRSSLVWVERDDVARGLLSLDDLAFSARLEGELDGQFGVISDVGKRGCFAIRGAIAREFARDRVFLIGEAGHVLPPIGAQGLNLSLRDAALAVELIGDAHVCGDDIGGYRVLRAYDRHRRADVLSRQIPIDLLNRTLVSTFLPFQGVRSLGLAALGAIGPLRRSVMRHGLSPSRDLPRVMRG